jgi:hypothetical protein
MSDDGKSIGVCTAGLMKFGMGAAFYIACAVVCFGRDGTSKGVAAVDELAGHLPRWCRLGWCRLLLADDPES